MKLSKILTAISFASLGICSLCIINPSLTNDFNTSSNSKIMSISGSVEAQSYKDFIPVYSKDLPKEAFDEEGFLKLTYITDENNKEETNYVTYLQLFCGNQNIANSVVNSIKYQEENKNNEEAKGLTVDSYVNSDLIKNVKKLDLSKDLKNDSTNSELQLLVAVFANPNIEWDSLTDISLFDNNLTQLPENCFRNIKTYVPTADKQVMNIILQGNKITGVYGQLFNPTLQPSGNKAYVSLNLSNNNIVNQTSVEIANNANIIGTTRLDNNNPAINLNEKLLREIIIENSGTTNQNIWPENIDKTNLLQWIDNSQLISYPLLLGNGQENIGNNIGQFKQIEYSANNMTGNLSLSLEMNVDTNNSIETNYSTSFNALYIGLAMDSVFLGILTLCGIIYLSKLPKKTNNKNKKNKK